MGHTENGLDLYYETYEDIKGKIIKDIPISYENGILYFKSKIGK